MSLFKPKAFDFDLKPGVSLRIRSRSVVMRFRFPKKTFTDYLAENSKIFSPDIYTILAASSYGIKLPDGLLREIISHLEQAESPVASLETTSGS
jgi:hypothetical protein